jgi:hypothetical protein
LRYPCPRCLYPYFGTVPQDIGYPITEVSRRNKIFQTHRGEINTDPVRLDEGYISGTVLGEPGREVHIYRGIPYAAPPVGGLRWKPPQAVARDFSWEKIIEVDQAVNVGMGPEFVFMGPWNVSVDGWFMPDTPPSIFKAGKQNAVPFIVVAILGVLAEVAQ